MVLVAGEGCCIIPIGAIGRTMGSFPKIVAAALGVLISCCGTPFCLGNFAEGIVGMTPRLLPRLTLAHIYKVISLSIVSDAHIPSIRMIKEGPEVY